MTRASKADVRRRASDVKLTLADIDRALRVNDFDRATALAGVLFELARGLEYSARALARAKAASAAAAERRELSRTGAP